MREGGKEGGREGATGGEERESRPFTCARGRGRGVDPLADGMHWPPSTNSSLHPPRCTSGRTHACACAPKAGVSRVTVSQGSRVDAAGLHAVRACWGGCLLQQLQRASSDMDPVLGSLHPPRTDCSKQRSSTASMLQQAQLACCNQHS